MTRSILGLLKRLADNTNRNSLATALRLKRFEIFRGMLEKLSGEQDRALSILDVGGTESFWEFMNYTQSNHSITLLNIDAPVTKDSKIMSVAGDARAMPQFSDRQFDIVFSNSVIEHVGSIADQARMASEIRRVASSYFVQTPNFYFPIEPHFLFPFFHWFPRAVRIYLVRTFSLGWYQKAMSTKEAAGIVDGIRLMRYSEFRDLFSDATIVRERLFGLTKSFIALKQWQEIRSFGQKSFVW